MVYLYFLVFYVDYGIVYTIYQTGVNMFGLDNGDSVKICQVSSYCFCR